MSISDPSDPNYFRLSSIADIRGLLVDLRDHFEDHGCDDEATFKILGDLIRTAWPALQPEFDPAFEADRAFIARLEGREP